jgi:hypothetical protein
MHTCGCYMFVVACCFPLLIVRTRSLTRNNNNDDIKRGVGFLLRGRVGSVGD